jgi:hypothetical protein
VLDLNEESPGPPWISVDAHKDGTEPSGCVVQNNLVTDLSNASTVDEENNIVFAMSEAPGYFVDAAGYDVHLLDDAPAIDAGTSTGAPEFDHDGIPRPQGDAVDVGAYEWHDGSVEPMAGAGGAPGPSTASTSSGGAAGALAGDDVSSGDGGTTSGSPAASSSSPASSTTASSGQGSGNSGDDGGCGCSVPGGRGSRPGPLSLFLALLFRKRRSLARSGILVH